MPIDPEDVVYKDISEFTEKESLDGTEELAISTTEKINLLKQIIKSTNGIDVTAIYPLPEGEYYTLTTAVAAIEENLRKVGYELSFVRKVVNDYYYETYKFKGLIEEFTDLSKWELEHNYLFDDITTKMPELFFNNDGITLSESMGLGDIVIPVAIGERNINIPFTFTVKDYLFIPDGTIVRTQFVYNSANSVPYTNNLFGPTPLSMMAGIGLRIPSNSLIALNFQFTEDMFLKPGDTMVFTIVGNRQTSTTMDYYTIYNNLAKPAMLVFIPMDKSYTFYPGKNISTAGTNAYYVYNNKKSNKNYMGLYKSSFNLDGYIKWKDSNILSLIFKNQIISTQSSTVYNKPHKLYLQNIFTEPLTISFSMFDTGEKLMSTFGSTYTLQPLYVTIITYQWVIWEDGTINCMLSKSDDFITQ